MVYDDDEVAAALDALLRRLRFHPEYLRYSTDDVDKRLYLKLLLVDAASPPG